MPSSWVFNYKCFKFKVLWSRWSCRFNVFRKKVSCSPCFLCFDPPPLIPTASFNYFLLHTHISTHTFTFFNQISKIRVKLFFSKKLRFFFFFFAVCVWGCRGRHGATAPRSPSFSRGFSESFILLHVVSTFMSLTPQDSFTVLAPVFTSSSYLLFIIFSSLTSSCSSSGTVLLFPIPSSLFLFPPWFVRLWDAGCFSFFQIKELGTWKSARRRWLGFYMIKVLRVTERVTLRVCGFGTWCAVTCVQRD